MLAGFVDPTAGTIAVDGRILSQPTGSVPPEKRNMSMIFQSYAIWPNMTVAENVAFGLKIRKLPTAEIRRQVGDVLGIVQLGALADRYPAELSGGQQQRVALARAIVIKPSVLLLDEPLSNLDANLREEMRSEIRRLHEAIKVTTVYVTHDQAEAMATSDRIAVMNQGRIEQVDAPHVLYTRPAHPVRRRFHRPNEFPRRYSSTARTSASTALAFRPPASRICSAERAEAWRQDRVLDPAAEPAIGPGVGAAARWVRDGRRRDHATLVPGRALGLHLCTASGRSRGSKSRCRRASYSRLARRATLVVDPALLVPIL